MRVGRVEEGWGEVGGGQAASLLSGCRCSGCRGAAPHCLGTAKTEDREQTHLVHLAGCDGGHAGKKRRSHPVARSDRWSCRSARPQSVSIVFHLGEKEKKKCGRGRTSRDGLRQGGFMVM